MEIRKSAGLLACALTAMALLSGCGSSATTTIPSVATIFYGHNLVFRNNTAMTMGYNGFGQLGLGNLDNQATATIVPNTGPVHDGATGGEHTIVFGNTSTVMTWGYNLYGQLGNPSVSTVTTAAYSATPVKVHGFGSATVTSVAAGGYHSLAVAGGVVYGWGYNGYGQVGDPSFNNAVSPFKVQNAQAQTTLGTVSNPAIQVAAGGNHSLALLSDGSVWGWGRNSEGELGVDPAKTPVGGFSSAALPVTIAPRLISQIAAEGSNSYALAKDHTVWAWGYNVDGELGVDPAVTPYSAVPLQVWKDAAHTVPLLASKISAGGNHVLAMQCDANGIPDNTLWAWGFNSFAQLGNNATAIEQFTPVQVLNVPTGTIVDIRAFGDYSMLKIGNDAIGTWYGWGDNGLGQLGFPVTTTSLGYLLVPTLVQGYRP